MLLAPSFLLAGTSGGTWSADIQATGQDHKGVNSYGVTIGVAASPSAMPAPPAPPEYSVKMELVGNDFPLATQFREAGQSSYSWVIDVDPNGNIMPPAAGTATIRWVPEQLGPGDFELRDGYDTMGEILVYDMKASSSYTFSGTAPHQFTIINNN